MPGLWPIGPPSLLLYTMMSGKGSTGIDATWSAMRAVPALYSVTRFDSSNEVSTAWKCWSVVGSLNRYQLVPVLLLAAVGMFFVHHRMQLLLSVTSVDDGVWA